MIDPGSLAGVAGIAAGVVVGLVARRVIAAAEPRTRSVGAESDPPADQQQTPRPRIRMAVPAAMRR